MVEATIQYDGGGAHVLWYREDENGENPEECRWYGSYQQCEIRVTQPPPTEGWVPISDGGSPPHDAATASGMYDRL